MLQSQSVYQPQHFPHPENNWIAQPPHQQHQQQQQHVNSYGISQTRGLLAPSHPSPAPSSALGMGPRTTNEDDAKIFGWIVELVQGERKETALLELSKKREQVDDLAIILWHSVGWSAFFQQVAS